MKRTLLLALVPLALLGACQRPLGPNEAEYAYRNDQNSFARLQIDGNITGSTLRPGEVRNFPLVKTAPHTIIVQRGAYEQVMGGRGNFYEDYVVKSNDPPFTLEWMDNVWKQTGQ